MLPVTSDAALPSSLLGDAFRVRARKKVRLGPVSVEICSNEADFKGFRFFSEVIGGGGFWLGGGWGSGFRAEFVQHRD